MSVFVFLLLLLLFSNNVITSSYDNTCSNNNADASECSKSSTTTKENNIIIGTIFLNYEEIHIVDDDDEQRFVKKSWTINMDENQEEHQQDYYIIEENKPILYVPNFINTSIANELKSFCINQNRFVTSPVQKTTINDDDNDDQKTDIVSDTSIRTSESCTMIPSYQYMNNPNYIKLLERPHQEIGEKTQRVIREVDVTYYISRKASSLLKLDLSSVEPLQLVRYTTPQAQYKVHHDHGSYYNNDDAQRPWTMLLFLNDVEEGGYTSFPKLNNLKIKPKECDAIIWSNVIQNANDDDNEEEDVVDRDMVHAGEPPTKEGIEKYAVNIWFGKQEQKGINNKNRW